MMNSAANDFLLGVLVDPLPVEGLRMTAGKVRDWGALLARAQHQDVVPQLYRAISALGDGVPEDVRKQVRVMFAAGALRSLRFAGERRRVTALLTAAGIPVLPWKGPVLAERYYGDVALRSCVDLDLLVPSDRAWAALQLLQDDGYCLAFPLPKRRWPALQRTVNHLTLDHAQRDTRVELHWEFFHPMYAMPFDPAPYWQPVPAGHAACEGRLGNEETLVLLCAHGTVHAWEKLKWVADIDRVVRCRPGLDWERVFSRAAGMGTGRCLRLGLILARDLCSWRPPSEISRRLEGDPVAARLAAAVQTRLFAAQPPCRGVLGEHRFQSASRERRRDRLRFLWRQFLFPRQADWQCFAPGSYCYPLFFLERPLRMIWKWLFQPLIFRR